MATGVVLGVNESIVEDACWLRPINDARYISLAELDAVIEGDNLALQWQARVLHVVTNSACVHRWVSDTLTEKAHVNTKVASKMLVKRRLGTLRALIEEYMLTMDITLVKSCQIRAESLTRVPQRWLDLHKKEEQMLESCATVTSQLSKSQVADNHQKSSHPGVKRTLYLARIIDPTVSKELIKSVVRAYEACQSTDQASVLWEKRDLSVKKNWSKLTMGMTYYDGGHFLTLIDCAPSCITICGHYNGKTPSASFLSLRQFFNEQKPPAMILTDNDTAFTCRQCKEFTNMNFEVPVCLRTSQEWHREMQSQKHQNHCSQEELSCIGSGLLVQRDTQGQPLIFYIAGWRATSVPHPSVRHWCHSSPKPQITGGRCEKGDIAWVKNPPHTHTVGPWPSSEPDA